MQFISTSPSSACSPPLTCLLQVGPGGTWIWSILWQPPVSVMDREESWKMKIMSLKAFHLNITGKPPSPKIFCPHFVGLWCLRGKHPTWEMKETIVFFSFSYNYHCGLHQIPTWENFNVAFHLPLNTSFMRIIFLFKIFLKRKLTLVILELLPWALYRKEQKTEN